MQRANTFSIAFFTHQNNYPGVGIGGNKKLINQQV